MEVDNFGGRGQLKRRAILAHHNINDDVEERGDQRVEAEVEPLNYYGIKHQTKSFHFEQSSYIKSQISIAVFRR
jgi:hypothetical protein